MLRVTLHPYHAHARMPTRKDACTLCHCCRLPRDYPQLFDLLADISELKSSQAKHVTFFQVGFSTR